MTTAFILCIANLVVAAMNAAWAVSAARMLARLDEVAEQNARIAAENAEIYERCVYDVDDGK